MDIRVQLNDNEFFTLPVSVEVSFAAVRNQLAKFCPLNLSSNSWLEFEDNEGHSVTVRCDEDFSSLRQLCNSVVFRCRPLCKAGDTIATEGEREEEEERRKRRRTRRPPKLFIPPPESSQEPPPPLPPPVTVPVPTEADIDYYDVIGQGQFGIVYQAFHRVADRLVAVKCVDVNDSDGDVELRRKILSELNILSKCKCRHIIDYYGAFFVDNSVHICTEWMDAGSLDKWGIVPETVLGYVNNFVVNGLLYLWQNGVMHRDVKGANILVNTVGEVKLCDFGLSVELMRSIAVTYCGTVAYMSPERITGQEYRIQSDVWSLGVTLFELATGKLPFVNANGQTVTGTAELIHVIVNLPEPRLSQSEFTPEFREFVHACLIKQPDERANAHTICCLAFHILYGCNEAKGRLAIANWVKKIMKRL